jgi:hypothetical protein
VNYSHTACWALLLSPGELTRAQRLMLWLGPSTNASSYHVTAQAWSSRQPPTSSRSQVGLADSGSAHSETKHMSNGLGMQLDWSSFVRSTPVPRQQQVALSHVTVQLTHNTLSQLLQRTLCRGVMGAAAWGDVGGSDQLVQWASGASWVQEGCRTLARSTAVGVEFFVQFLGLTQHIALHVTQTEQRSRYGWARSAMEAVNWGRHAVIRSKLFSWIPLSVFHSEDVGLGGGNAGAASGRGGSAGGRACLHPTVVQPCYGGAGGECGDARSWAAANLTSFSLATCWEAAAAGGWHPSGGCRQVAVGGEQIHAMECRCTSTALCD